MRVNNKFFVRLFFKCGWSIFIIFLGMIVYHFALQSKKQDLVEISYRLHELEKEKYLALQEKENLLLEIHSQSDPAWVELVLKKNLGVVPDGQKKVHFTNLNHP